MSPSRPPSALDAFIRLLEHAHAGGQAKVDALLALSQRTLFVPKSTTHREGFARLVNETGAWALPVFTSRAELEAAADEFGWRFPDGSIRHEEIGARRAVHYALEEGASFMVVDAMAPHALEASRAEIEPLVSTLNRSDAAGPFAGVGRISSSMLEAVRPSETALPAISDGSVPAEIRDRRGRSRTPSSFPPPTRRSSAPPEGDGGAGGDRGAGGARGGRQRSMTPSRPIAPRTRPAPVSTISLNDSPPVREPISAFPDVSLGASDRAAFQDPIAVVRPSSKPPSRSASATPPSVDLEPPPLDLDLEPPPPLPSRGSKPPRRSSTPGAPPNSELPPTRNTPRADLNLDASTSSSSSAFIVDDGTIEIRVLPEPPTDAILADFTEVLRDYPEVEWASFSHIAQGDVVSPGVGLRMAESFRENVPEITRRLKAVGREHGERAMVVLLDDLKTQRDARNLAEIFFPWRRKNRE